MAIRKALGHFVRVFVTGALVALPLAATAALCAWAVSLLIGWLGPSSQVGGVLSQIGLGVTGSEIVGYAMGIGIVLAAIFALGLLAEVGLQQGMNRVLRVNLKGAFLGTQAAARQMIAQGRGGVIINMSSINSGLANPRVATYAISKGGMNQITGTAAVAFAPHGIRVVGVGPGTIMTEMVEGSFIDSPATERMILSRTPMGRCGTAEEVAAVVAFLASDDASYITGETIYPDGGRRVLNYVMPAKE